MLLAHNVNLVSIHLVWNAAYRGLLTAVFSREHHTEPAHNFGLACMSRHRLSCHAFMFKIGSWILKIDSSTHTWSCRPSVLSLTPNLEFYLAVSYHDTSVTLCCLRNTFYVPFDMEPIPFLWNTSTCCLQAKYGVLELFKISVWVCENYNESW